ncbi:MAG: HEAT repeat domain-containing protein [Candidatus Sulfotelmatobacter sp.]
MIGGLWFASLSASAQDLQGRFYPEKERYVVGEPVIFNVEIKNTGNQVVYLPAKGSKCLDTYAFSVSGSGAACRATWDAACQDDESPLAPGDVIHGEWPLDSWYRFEREGKYAVSATRHVPIRNSRGEIHDFIFSSKFEVNLEPADPLHIRSILQEFERNLHSNDPDVRHAALDVLATTAPSYFEATALRLSRDEDPFVVLHAVAALGRMNTPETRAALADVIAPGKSSAESAPNKPVTDYGVARIRAIEALGRSGDGSYQGLIERYTDDKNEYVQLAAMVAIAELGKAEAVPELERFLFSADPVTRKNAAYGLRYSTAPDAVETLIDAIADKDSTVRERVLTSLNQVTGQSFGDNSPDVASALKIQNEWRLWWKTHEDKFVVPELKFLCDMK